MMHSPITITEAVFAAILCLYAVGTSRGADATQQGRDRAYEAAVARAEVLYRAAQDVCENDEGSQRAVCFREAKATHIRAIVDAKARLEAARMVADGRQNAGDTGPAGKR